MVFSKDFKKAAGQLDNDVDILMLDIDDIIVKDQVRTVFSDEKIVSLAKNILSQGQMFNPLVIERVDDGFVLNQGERRLRALKYLVEQGHNEFKRVACRLSEFTSELDSFLAQFSENEARENLSAFEVADALESYRTQFDSKHGWMKRFADRNGLKKDYVSRHFALLKVPKCVRALCDSGIVTSPKSLLLIHKHPNTTDVCAAIEKGVLLGEALLINKNPSPAKKGTKAAAESSPSKGNKKAPASPKDTRPHFSTSQVDSMAKYLMEKENLADFDALIKFVSELDVEK